MSNVVLHAVNPSKILAMMKITPAVPNRYQIHRKVQNTRPLKLTFDFFVSQSSTSSDSTLQDKLFSNRQLL